MVAGVKVLVSMVVTGVAVAWNGKGTGSKGQNAQVDRRHDVNGLDDVGDFGLRGSLTTIWRLLLERCEREPTRADARA